LLLTFLFAITNAGGLHCARYVPRKIFVRDVQMLVTLNHFTRWSEYAGKHTKGVTSDYSSLLALFTNFGSLYNVVMSEEVQSTLGILRSRLCCTIVFTKFAFFRIQQSKQKQDVRD